jgi:hypothetical protein
MLGDGMSAGRQHPLKFGDDCDRRHSALEGLAPLDLSFGLSRQQGRAIKAQAGCNDSMR